jgi:RHS repeat-associated protein
MKRSVSRTNNKSFDSMGRLLTSEQITDSQSYPFEYTYNLSGALIEEKYPSTRVVKYTLNSDGQLEQVQSKKNSTSGYWSYADSFTYNAAGAVTKMQLGNGLWETADFNERLQVKMIGLGTLETNANKLELDFGYTGSDPTNNVGDRNNGSLRSQTIKVPAVGSNAAFNAVQTYTYDSLNRVQTATETVSSTQTWKQEFGYDRYGNRNFVTGSGHTTTLGSCSTAVCNPSFDTSRNRFSSSQGYSYDSGDDITQDATGQRFHYDSEQRQDQFFATGNSGSTPDATYSYDGSGQRVKKVSSTETTIFVYDASGLMIAEYSTASTNKPQVSYMTADHLGSPRIITNENGAVTSRKDFTAFGEEVTSSQRVSGTLGNGYDALNVRQDYTGYQKDDESGLEYAQARYFNAQHGRFTSPDPLMASASIRNPQTFNRYSYVTNSPYKFVDPLGLTLMDAGIYLTSDSTLPGALDRAWIKNFRAASEELRKKAAQGQHRASDQQSQAHSQAAAPPPQPTAEQNQSGGQTNNTKSENDPKADGPKPVAATVTPETIAPNYEQVGPNTYKVGTMGTFLISVTGDDGKPFEGTVTEVVESKVNGVSTNTVTADEVPLRDGQFRDIFAPPGLVTMSRVPTQTEIDAISAPMETKATRVEQTATFTISSPNARATLTVFLHRVMTNVDARGALRNPNSNNTRFVLFKPSTTVISIPPL